MADANQRIIRAACGDVQALAAITSKGWRNDALLLAALLRCDCDPPPIAMLTALVKIDNPPKALRDAVRRVLFDALRTLGRDDADALRDELRHRLPEAITDLAAAEAPSQDRRTVDIRVFMSDDAACDPAIASAYTMLIAALRHRLPWRYGDAAFWRALADNDLAQFTRIAVRLARRAIDEAARSSGDDGARSRELLRQNQIEDIVGAFWMAMTDDDRIIVARAAREAGIAVAQLLRRIGVEGWKIAPDEARAILLDALCSDPQQAAQGGGVIWSELGDDDRLRIVRSVAGHPYEVNDLLKRMGVEGWRQATDEMRETLFETLCNEPHLASRCGMIWSDLGDDDRLCIVRSIARYPYAASSLLQLMGVEGLRQATDEVRATLLETLCANPHAAAQGGGAIWSDLRDDERRRIASVVCDETDAAADLMRRIGCDGWAQTPNEARAALIAAICRDPLRAAQGGGSVWMTLNDDERAKVGAAAAVQPECAARLMELIGVTGWERTPEATRAALLRAARRTSTAASQGGGSVWASLTPRDRVLTARSAARSAISAARLMQRIGADGWTIAPDEAKDALLRVLQRDRRCAAVGGGEVWAALNEQERACIVSMIAPLPAAAAELIERIGATCNSSLPQAISDDLLAVVACDPRASAIAILTFGDALSDVWKRRLLRSALFSRETSLAVAQDVRTSGVWRDWMLAFAPDVNSDSEVKVAWGSIARYLPLPYAAALLARAGRR